MLDKERTAAANYRETEPAKLIHAVRGDLDWIVMRCLEKDRARRYATANGLAADLQRHLNNEPVVASPPSNLYRFQKLVRRNKGAFAAAAAVSAVLVLGLGVSTWLLIEERATRQRATRAEGKANTEVNKSRQVTGFLKEMLRGVGPSKAKGRDTQMLREILDETAERVGRSLPDQPGAEAELESTIGEVYLALGLHTNAEQMFRKAVEIQGRAGDGNRLELAASREGLAGALASQPRLADAETMQRQVLSAYNELLGPEDPRTTKALSNLAEILWNRGNVAEVEAICRKVLAINRKVLGDAHPDVAEALNNLATVLLSEGKLVEAEPLQREAVALYRRVSGPDDLKLANALNNLGAVLKDEGRPAEAEAAYRETLAIQQKVLDGEHPQIAITLNNLANVLEPQGKFAEAEAVHRQALALKIKRLGEKHPQVADSLSNLANLLRRTGRWPESEELERKALAMRRELLGNDHPRVGISLENLSDLMLARTNLVEAEALQRDALAVYRKAWGNEHPDVATSLIKLARVLQAAGKPAEAETAANEALATQRKVLGAEHPDIAPSLERLAMLKREGGKLAEAEALVRESLCIREKKQAGHWRMFSTRVALGELLLQQKNYAEAEPLLLSGYGGMKEREATIPAESKLRLKTTLESLVQFYEATGRPNQAAEWKKTLEAFSQSEAQKPPATPTNPQ